ATRRCAAGSPPGWQPREGRRGVTVGSPASGPMTQDHTIYASVHHERASTQSPIALSTREMSTPCLLILLVFAIGVSLKASGSKWTLGSDAWTLGGDFIELYSAGRVLKDRQP